MIEEIGGDIYAERDASLFRRRGLLYLVVGEPEKALEDFKMALALEKNEKDYTCKVSPMAFLIAWLEAGFSKESRM